MVPELNWTIYHFSRQIGSKLPPPGERRRDYLSLAGEPFYHFVGLTPARIQRAARDHCDKYPW